MSNTIQSSGNYLSKVSGSTVNFEFEYAQFDSIEDAIDVLGEAKALSMLQRMEKVDAGNNAREKAKVANGDSTRKVMTEEEKAEGKAKRAEGKANISKLQSLADAQGVTVAELLESL